MYWVHVARKDFADAVRSKLFWGLSGVMLVLAYLGMYVPRAVDGSSATASDGIGVLSGVVAFLVPIVALVAGYMSIVGERQTGSIRMVLSLPLKRWELFAGKLVGRGAVVVLAVLLGFALAVPFVLVVYGELPWREYAEFVTGVSLVGVTFVAIAVGISGSVSTRGKALAGVVGVYALVEFFWETIPLALYYILNGEIPSEDVPTWFEATTGASPVQAALRTGEALFGGLSTGEPLVLQEWFGGVWLALWMLVPLAIGYLRFERADIS